MSDTEQPSDIVEITRKPDHTWIVVRTKPRCEKKLNEFCKNRGIVSYLPLRRSVRRYRNRKVEFMVPIFSGYVFCHVPIAQYSTVNECRHTAHILRPDSDMEDQLIEELRGIRIFEAAMKEGEITVRPEIEVGRRVNIKSGPLSGLTGIVTRWKGKVRLAVNVEMVGQSVSIEVDAAEVELDD